MMAFERIEPFGALADEFRLGQIAATLANVHRAPNTDAFGPADFMPALHRALEAAAPPPVAKSPEELSNLLDAELFGHTAH